MVAYTQFWGVESPLDSPELMHFGELHTMAENGVYCTELLRQAAANLFTLELHLYHPLAQLPDMHEVFDLYCTTVIPVKQGMPEASKIQRTLKWTVATPDVPRDLQTMAVLDEHIDFNHWSLLCKCVNGNAYNFILPLGELKQYKMIVAGGCDVGEEASFDGDQVDNFSIRFRNSHFNCAGDENYYSILGDECNMGNINASEFEDEVAPSPDISEDSAFKFVLSVAIGDEFRNATGFYEYVCSYADEREFDVSIESSNPRQSWDLRH